jgi:hypothetical protein
VRIWEGVTVKNICLETELTFAQGGEVIPDPIGETVRNILTNMGLQVEDHGAFCDATLTLITHVEALNGWYVPGGTCYTGGNVYVTISFTAKGQEAFGTVISAEHPAGKSVSARWCEEHKRPEDFLEYPVFSEIWSEPFLDILADLWGPQALVWTLDQIVPGQWPNFVSRKLEAIGPTDEVVHALIYALQDESDDLRKNAAQMAGDFAPEAEEAIPFLAQAVKDDTQIVRWAAESALKRFGTQAVDAVPMLIEVLDTDTYDSRTRSFAYEVLKAITGQDFGMEAEKWQDWWEAER